MLSAYFMGFPLFRERLQASLMMSMEKPYSEIQTSIVFVSAGTGLRSRIPNALRIS